MKIEDCIYLSVCENECKQSCIRYLEMKYLLNQSGIPQKLRGFNPLTPDECDFKAFKDLAYVRENIIDFVELGQQLYIYSRTCGNGKTTWAIKIMLQYFNEMWAGNGFTPRGLFINVPTFINAHKNNISVKDDNLERVVKQLPKVDLVIWDDIATDYLTTYEHEILLSYIDQRVVEGKSNIYTGNILPSELQDKLGNRLASRINYSTQIQLQGGDMRYGAVANFE